MAWFTKHILYPAFEKWFQSQSGFQADGPMGHAKEIITLDVYGDNREIIADCVDEIQAFIDEVLPTEDLDREVQTENIDVVISAEDYLI